MNAAAPPAPFSPGASPAASALLDEREGARARDLVAWTDEHKRLLGQAFEDLQHAWQTQWCMPAMEGPDGRAPVVLREAAQRAGQDGDVHAARPRWGFVPPRHASSVQQSAPRPDDAAAAQHAACVCALASQMFGVDARRADKHVMAMDVADAAMSDWLERLQAWLGVQPMPDAGLQDASPAQAAGSLWSGCLQLSAPWCGGTWLVYLPQTAVRHALGPAAGVRPRVDALRPATADLGAAIAGEAVGLRVTLSDIQLSLRQLQDLRLGDVVTLPHALDQPAGVFLQGGTPLCRCWLGRQGNHVAVELAEAASASAAR